MNARILLPIATIAFAALASAAELPEPVIPAGVGVNIHFTRGREADLDLLAAGGFKFIRMDFGWEGTERRKGEYDWSAYDALLAGLDQRGVRAMFILDYGNKLYEEPVTSTDPITKQEKKITPSPQHPESVAAFAAWAAAAAKHYQGRHVLWEIWNEPNIGFWQPKPDVKQYIAVALATVKAVKAADPQATIVGPATSEFPWPFLEEFCASGVLADLDAVSIHPYRGSPPETAAADFARLRALIARYAPDTRKNLPILSGEWGYATNTKGTKLETQAAYIVRQQLSNLLNGVPLSIWYDWKNDGKNPDYNEDNFGTVTNDLQPKPSYTAIQTMTRQLAGCRIARRLTGMEGAAKDDYALLCVTAKGEQKLVAWTAGQPHGITVEVGELPADSLAAVGLDGAASAAAKYGAGTLALALGPAPVYVTFRTPSKLLAVVAGWKVTLAQPTVEAGQPGNLRVMVEATNPFAEPARMTAELGDVVERTKPVVVDIQPGAAGVIELKGTLVRRDNPVVTVRGEFHTRSAAGDWRMLHSFTEPLPVMLTNPLAVALVPAERGLWLQVDNPSGAALAAQARGGGMGFPVKLPAGRTSATYAFAPGQVGRREGGFGVVQLVDEAGHTVAECPRVALQPVAASAYKAVLDGDAKIEAKAAITKAAPPEPGAGAAAPGGPVSGARPEAFARQGAEVPAGTAPWSDVFALDYDCAPGWRFVRCVPDTDQPVPIAGQPAALGLWIQADGAGDALRARITDATGQTFQPAGPNLTWKDWRWVVIPLGDMKNVSHWGGANDGVPHLPLHWDCPLLVDPGRKATKGTIRFAGVTLLYDVKE